MRASILLAALPPLCAALVSGERAETPESEITPLTGGGGRFDPIVAATNEAQVANPDLGR